MKKDSYGLQRQGVIEAWMPGDDAEAARYLFKTFHIEYTPEALRLWRIGKRRCKVERYAIKSYQAVQKDRTHERSNITRRINSRANSNP